MHRIFFLLISFCFIFFPAAASAGVVIYDDVSPANKTVKLRALTKGRFFPEGGKLVTFYVGDKKIDSRLSGGDGYAFIKYKPASPGAIKIKAESGEEADEGVLLITHKNDRVILVDIENTLFESVFSLKPVKEGKEALRQLSDKYRIIFLTTLIGITQSRQWLKDNKFPLSPVFKWEGAGMIDELMERGLRLYAIIGSPEVITDAPDIEKRFSFNETEDGTEVKDWDELLKTLK